MSPTKSMTLLSNRRQEISDCGGRLFGGMVGENRTVRPTEVVHNPFGSDRPKKCAFISMGGPQPMGTQNHSGVFRPHQRQCIMKEHPGSEDRSRLWTEPWLRCAVRGSA